MLTAASHVRRRAGRVEIHCAVRLSGVRVGVLIIGVEAMARGGRVGGRAVIGAFTRYANGAAVEFHGTPFCPNWQLLLNGARQLWPAAVSNFSS